MSDNISRSQVLKRIDQIIRYRLKLSKQAYKQGRYDEAGHLEGSCFPFQLLEKEIRTGEPCDLLAPVPKKRKRAA